MTEVPSAGMTTGSLNEPYPTAAPSFGQLILTRCEKSANREAFRSPTKDGGWKSWTWTESLEEASKLAAGLVALGIGIEERVAIASNTRLEWIFADMAIMLSGAATTTVYPSTGDEDVEYILADSNSKILIAEDQTQADKAKNVDSVHHIILMDGEGDGEKVLSWADVCAKGEAEIAKNANLIQERVDQTGPEKLATLIYTSGTTGKPKGVELSHANWCYEGAALDGLNTIQEDWLQFLWLPMAHSFGKVLMAAQFQIGFPTAVDGRVPEIINNLPVVKPDFMAAVPRIFEKVYAGVNRQVKEEGGAKASIFEWAFKVGKKARDKRLAGESVGGLLGVQLGLADKLVYSKVRARMGGNLKYFISGSAALSRDINEWFDIVGLTILEGYGLTETSAGTTINRPGHVQIGTVGQPLPGTEIRIAEDGEIMVRGGGVMLEYRNRPEDNAEVFGDQPPGPNRWFATGDIGVIDEGGRLKITDRKKDLVKTSGGKYIAPGAIEAMFKAHCPIAGQVVIIANERNFASALVALDPDAAKQWADANGKTGESIAEMAKDPAVIATIQEGVNALNGELNKWETIKQFRVIPQELTVDDGFLTPSLKVKRKVVEEHFSGLVDDIYSGGN